MRGIRKPFLLLIFSLFLGNYYGRIALLDGSGQPKTVFSQAVASLPAADRAALNRGIPIHSREQLLELMEDYLS